MVQDFAPDVVHIATEGPLGWAARRYCRRRALPFTTAFHTRFPENVALRTGLPATWFWPALRRFHAGSRAVLVATPRLADRSEEHTSELQSLMRIPYAVFCLK